MHFGHRSSIGLARAIPSKIGMCKSMLTAKSEGTIHALPDIYSRTSSINDDSIISVAVSIAGMVSGKQLVAEMEHKRAEERKRFAKLEVNAPFCVPHTIVHLEICVEFLWDVERKSTAPYMATLSLLISKCL